MSEHEATSSAQASCFGSVIPLCRKQLTCAACRQVERRALHVELAAEIGDGSAAWRVWHVPGDGDAVSLDTAPS